MSKTSNCGWLSDYGTLVNTPAADVLASLEDFVNEINPSQTKSWAESIPIIQREAAKVLGANPAGSSFSALLEYELPREGGRRPDLIALQNRVVIVTEFKEHAAPLPQHIDQVAAYARDIKNYHEASHELEVVPVLIPCGYKGRLVMCGGVAVISPQDVASFLLAQAGCHNGTIINSLQWVESNYAPLPSLVRAARMLFNKEPLPRIKRAQSARVPEVVDFILSLCRTAAAAKTRHLVLLTGAPGSGKTLVGLQLAHSEKLEELRVAPKGRASGAPAVFLSGNDPLVEVLQNALQNKAFVAGMKKFIDYYGFSRPNLIPSEHVLIFDEAQRAWDAEHMEHKHGKAVSEPEVLLQIASRIPEWSVVVALIGEGQEIHTGEEAGLDGWRNALSLASNPADWTIHGAPHALDMFSGVSAKKQTNDLLNLTTSLRSHLATDLHDWVKKILGAGPGDFPALQALQAGIRNSGFQTYVTYDLGKAKKYVQDRYADSKESRYGLIASRYAKNLRPLHIDNSYKWKRDEKLPVGYWFNAPPGDPMSCCALQRPATEFECQGLELDLPIICWGDDFLWTGTEWLPSPTSRTKLDDPKKITCNAYRVLLTRGRDGMIIFIPPSADPRFAATYHFFIDAGCQPL